MGRSCTRTPVNWEIGSHGWNKTKKDSKSSVALSQSLCPLSEGLNTSAYNMLVPTSFCRESWVAGQSANKCIDSSCVSFFSPMVTFLWPLKRLWTLAGQICNFKPFQGISILTQNVRSAINFLWYLCLLSDLYMEFLHPAPQYLRAWPKRYAFCHRLKAYLFFSIHVCWI